MTARTNKPAPIGVGLLGHGVMARFINAKDADGKPGKLDLDGCYIWTE